MSEPTTKDQTALSKLAEDAGLTSSEINKTGAEIPELGDWKSKLSQVKVAPEQKTEAPRKEAPKEVLKEAPKVEPTEELEIELEEIEDPTLQEPKEVKKGEPKKEEPKKAAVTESDEEEGDEKLPEGSLQGKERDVREAFRKLRTSLKAKIKDLESKSKTGTVADPELQGKLEAALRERDELSAKVQDQEQYVQIATVEQSDHFRQQVTQPKNQMKQDIIRISKDNGGVEGGVSASEIWNAIITEDRAKLNSILPLITEADKVELVSLSRDYKGIHTVEKEMRENAKETLSAMEANQTKQQREIATVSKKIYQETVTAGVDKIKKDNPNLFKKYEGADDWNTEVDRAETWVEHMTSADPLNTRWLDHFGDLVSKSAAFDLATNRIKRLETELGKVRSKLAQKRASTPGAGSGGSVPTAPATGGARTIPTMENFFNRKK